MTTHPDQQTDQSDEFELELTAMANGGSALGRHEGRTIFVPYAIPGEHITARITQDKGRFAYAEGITLLEGSEARVQPRCPHFGPGRCGGCQWQHIDYPAQLEFKRQVVADQIARLGGFPDVTVHPMIPSPDPWQYRSNITFHLTGKGQLGFIATDDRHVIPIEECHIIRPELLDLFDSLDLEGLTGLTRVRLQVGSDGAQRSIILSTHDDQPPEVESDMPASVNFLFEDNEPLNLIGSSHVDYTVKGRKFRVTAGGFFQVNIPQAETLVDQVLSRLDLHGTESVLDLYAGVGLFTAFLAERAALVTSIESYPPAVTDADQNLAEFDNIDLIEGGVEDVLSDLEGPFELAVVDPPRAGMEPEALDALAAFAPLRIVYVSCDPATFARDAKRLAVKGYRLVDVQPLDMFPQTWHIELVASFHKA
ncbi:MAG: class I SAM-dependent RNA methyltransferase [Chloroflexota bacterium]